MRKRTVGLLIISCLIIILGIWIFNKNQRLNVEVASVKRGEIINSVEELGLVKEENSISVFNTVGGRVIDIEVEPGDYVHEGDLLVRIDDGDLRNRFHRLESQKASLVARYDEALKPIDEREIKKIELQLAGQEKILRELEEKRDGHKILYEAGAISYQEYKNIFTETDLAKLSRDAIKLDLEILQKPDFENIKTQFQEELRGLDIELEELKDKLRRTLILAPIEGVIMEGDIEQGIILQGGEAVFKVADIDDLYIESDILVGDIGKVKLGADVEISHRDFEIQGIKGRVRKIYPKAFSRVSDLGIEQKRVKVEIEILGDPKEIYPGYDLDLEIIFDRKKDVLLVPSKGVFEHEDKDYVFLNENNIAVLRQIQKGIKDRNYIEVIEGLEEGEEIILSPGLEVKEGSKILPKNYGSMEGK